MVISKLRMKSFTRFYRSWWAKVSLARVRRSQIVEYHVETIIVFWVTGRGNEISGIGILWNIVNIFHWIIFPSVHWSITFIFPQKRERKLVWSIFIYPLIVIMDKKVIIDHLVIFIQLFVQPIYGIFVRLLARVTLKIFWSIIRIFCKDYFIEQFMKPFSCSLEFWRKFLWVKQNPDVVESCRQRWVRSFSKVKVKIGVEKKTIEDQFFHDLDCCWPGVFFVQNRMYFPKQRYIIRKIHGDWIEEAHNLTNSNCINIGHFLQMDINFFKPAHKNIQMPVFQNSKRELHETISIGHLIRENIIFCWVFDQVLENLEKSIFPSHYRHLLHLKQTARCFQLIVISVNQTRDRKQTPIIVWLKFFMQLWDRGLWTSE